MSRSAVCLLGAGLLAAGLAVPSTGAPERTAPVAKPVPHAAAHLEAPEVKVQGYRIAVEKIVQGQNVALEFAHEGKGAPADGKLSGRQILSIYLAVHPPSPQRVQNIEGLSPNASARGLGDSLIAFRALGGDDSGTQLMGPWRAQLMAQDVDLGLSRISGLKGELVVYPNAHVVTLDFPITGKTPLTLTSGQIHATVKQVKVRPTTLTVNVEVQWPHAFSINHPNPDAPQGITALSQAGAVIAPTGGSTSHADHGANTVCNYSVSFSSPQGENAKWTPPSKIRLELLVRSGAPQKLPFTLPDLPLPDTLDPDDEAAEDSGFSARPALGSALYDARGGALEIPVRAAEVDTGHLLLGLARQEGAGYGPWRWMEITVGKNGTGSLARLRPGHYRVARLWTKNGAGAAPEHPSGAVEVEVVAGKSVSLPALTVGGTQ